MGFGSSKRNGFERDEKKVSFPAGPLRDCRKNSDLVIAGCIKTNGAMKFREEIELN